MDSMKQINELVKCYKKYNQLEIEIKAITGKSIEELRNLFIRGFTLIPPDYNKIEQEKAEIKKVENFIEEIKNRS